MLIEIKRLNKLKKDNELRISIEQELAELNRLMEKYAHYTNLALIQFISQYQTTLRTILDDNPHSTPKQKRTIELTAVQTALKELVCLAKLAESEKTPTLVFGTRALTNVKRSADNDLHYDTESFKQYILTKCPILKSPSALIERIQRDQRKDINTEHLDKLDSIEAIISEYKKSNKKEIKVVFLSKINELKEKLAANKGHIDFHAELRAAIQDLKTAEKNYYKNSVLLSSCFFKHAKGNSSLKPLIARIDQLTTDFPPRRRRASQ